MNTFLPYADFKKSAECLDDDRLGKQRVEGLQIILGQFPHHPACKMWTGYTPALVAYTLTCCEVWVARGNGDSIIAKLGPKPTKYELPYWFGNPSFHLPHQSKLLEKDWKHYSQFGWDVCVGLDYWWPPPRE